ncbi:MAG: bifunctional UDP-sugar hydrolase/5'-nucleotidase [Gemmatimonadota bacterium]|jgi:2',3'-cyclic-nucleotide 2'-phosphodiesterase/3'-nucleotidase|nr:hypothetical protein [Gemmatimonadota bacterium]MDP6460342.1 bifunctional UDP-sugar hydrolase/5'-nucleotidase [Gemmatimonadota bacterium]MDP6801993.1 bifunctional UDP-sugar hydrolase/5'-nucleotidase [Gemmatimonadota bacterium]MDP7031341.1 bifunctional UDP-sugar hydrolase/5'-nucleotidase [Gemmatimonadota bacterium]
MTGSSPEGCLTIVFTGDLHGRVSGTDPYTLQPFPGGAARAATHIAGVRERDPEAVFLDLGDLVQGTPMSTDHALGRGLGGPHPMLRILHELGCDGFVIGNHEFNFGMRWVEEFRRTARFPVLAANVLGPDGRPVFQPTLMLERGGLRVAVLAVTTPQVPRWEEPSNIEGLIFRDATETAREWVPKLRRDADAVVVAAHMSWEGVTDGGLETPEPPENDVARMVREVPGIDCILMAHTHRVEEGARRGGTLAVQAGWGGRAVGEVRLERDSHGVIRASSIVHQSRLDTPTSAAILNLAASEEETARLRLDQVIGEASGEFHARGVRHGETPLRSLLHRAQLEASGADLSSAALFREEQVIPPGPVTVRDLYRMIPFENRMVVVEMDAGGVREYLEETARAWAGPGQNGEPAPLNPRFHLYNHDTIAGVEYQVDPAQPVGSRIRDLTFGGEKVPARQKFTLATTNYRVSGGGGYRVLKTAKVLRRTGDEIRDLVISYVRRHGTIDPVMPGAWRLVGSQSGSA